MLSVIILEYVSYLPALIVGVVLLYRSYINKGIYLHILYTSVALIPALVTISTLMNIIILRRGITETSFFLANFTIAILSLIIVIYLERRLFTKKAHIQKEIVSLIILIITSLSIFDLVKSLVFFFYGLAAIIIIYITFRVTTVSPQNRLYKTGKVLIPVALLTDLFLKYISYVQLVPIDSIIRPALLLRGISTTFLALFLWPLSIGKEVEEERIAYHKRTINYLLLLCIIVTVVSQLLIYRSYYTVRRNENLIKDRYIEIVENKNTSTTGNLKHFLEEDALAPLTFLATTERIAGNEVQREDVIKAFYANYPNKFSYVTFVNNKGIIEYSLPEMSFKGKDISNLKHIKEVLSTQKPVLGEPYLDVRGIPVIDIYLPIYKDPSKGAIGVGINAGNIFKLLSSEKLPDVHNLILLDGTILGTDYKTTLTLQNFESSFPKETLSGYFTKRTPLIFLGRTFEVVTLINQNMYRAELQAFTRNQTLTTTLIVSLILLLLYIYIVTIARLDIDLGRAIEASIERETLELQKREETHKKLLSLNSFIYSTSLKEKEEDFFKKLLNVSLQLLPDGEKGSIWVNKGAYETPFVWVGYNEEDMQNLKIPIEQAEERWKAKNILILKNISEQDLYSKEAKAMLKKVTETIKSTIVAPLRIEGEYKGGIFIDSLTSDEAFDDEDIEIMHGISRIASYYLTTRKLFEDIAKESEKVSALTEKFKKIISFQRNIDLSKREETFYSDLLNLAISLVPKAEKGSVLIRRENELEYVAAEGLDLNKLKKIKIPVSVEERVTKKKKAKVIESIASHIKFGDAEMQVAKELKLFEIKSTITSSIFRGSEYFGGIFLDSSKSNAFTEEDKEVMTALSNIASFYTRSRDLLSGSKMYAEIENTVLKIYHVISSARNRKKAFRASFNIIQELAGNRVEFVSYIMEVTGEIIYNYIDKDKIRYETLEEFPKDIKEIKEPQFLTNIQKGSEIFEVATSTARYAYTIPVRGGVFAIGFKNKNIPEKTLESLHRLAIELSDIVQNFELTEVRRTSLVQTLIGLSKTIDSKDPYTRKHSEGVIITSYLIGKKMGLDNKNMRTLLYAALLHDIGKIGIPDSILQKPTTLTATEYRLVMEHPRIGAEIIKPIKFLSEAGNIIMFHQERYDGSGYPLKLKDGEIPLLARILSVADTFDAVISERKYRPGKTYTEAVKILINEKGHQLDPTIVDIFLLIPQEEIEKARKTTDLVTLLESLTLI